MCCTYVESNLCRASNRRFSTPRPCAGSANTAGAGHFQTKSAVTTSRPYSSYCITPFAFYPDRRLSLHKKSLPAGLARRLVKPYGVPYVFPLIAPARERISEVADRAGFLACGFNPRPNLPSLYGQWSLSASVPLTVTASRRIFTGFPFNRPCGSCPAAWLRSTAGTAPDSHKIIPRPGCGIKQIFRKPKKKNPPPAGTAPDGRTPVLH